ncbi:hypothetical protein IAT38_006286 [Cryptococcus sp. DSM 104549]
MTPPSVSPYLAPLTPPPTLPPTRKTSNASSKRPNFAALGFAAPPPPPPPLAHSHAHPHLHPPYLPPITLGPRSRTSSSESDSDDPLHKRRRLAPRAPYSGHPPLPPHTDSYSSRSHSRSPPPPVSGPPSRPPSTNTANGNAPNEGGGGGTHLAPPPASLSRRNANSLALKPIGFGASREARREDGYEGGAIPSPVVMGFDFKTMEEGQLKTVRDTLSIKEQQQALIAARRGGKPAAGPGTPRDINTPREIASKGFGPGGPGAGSGGSSGSGGRRGPVGPGGAGPTPTTGGVGRRREKIREKVEKMSIVTGAGDKDVVPGSKSAPLNHQTLSQQQASPREPPSGSQTAVPPHILPPLPAYHHDPRTAPISISHPHPGHPHAPHPRHPGLPPRTNSGGGGSGGARRANGEVGERDGERDRPPPGHEFARQQAAAQAQAQAQAAHRFYPSPRYEPGRGPPPPGQGQGQGQGQGDRRNFTVPSGVPRYNTSPRGSGSGSGHAPHPGAGAGGHSHSASPISPNPIAVSLPPRNEFLAPFSQLYDLLGTTDSLRFTLQNLLHRYESAYAQQLAQMSEFKGTANAAGVMLGNLQKSADSLREMVRYEVERGARDDRRELEELRERVRVLEAAAGGAAAGAGPAASAATAPAGESSTGEAPPAEPAPASSAAPATSAPAPAPAPPGSAGVSESGKEKEKE